MLQYFTQFSHLPGSCMTFFQIFCQNFYPVRNCFLSTAFKKKSQLCANVCLLFGGAGSRTSPSWRTSAALYSLDVTEAFSGPVRLLCTQSGLFCSGMRYDLQVLTKYRLDVLRVWVYSRSEINMFSHWKESRCVCARVGVLNEMQKCQMVTFFPAHFCIVCLRWLD